MSLPVAAVVLVALIVGFGAGWLAGRRTGRKRAMTATNLAVAAAADALYEVDQMFVSTEFDEEGTGTYARTEEGIVPRFDMSEIIIPYRSSVTPQGAVYPPELMLLPGTQGAVAWDPRISERTRVAGSIVIRGPFRASQKLPGYKLTQRFEKAFFVTRETTIQAYCDSAMQREYAGVAIHVPTRMLRCRVVFPPSHQKLSEGPSACAFIGESEFVNGPETNRISNYFTADAETAILAIENPRLGIRYAITWLAPAAPK